MKRTLVLLVLVLSFLPLRSAEVYNFTSFDVKDGLSDNFIHNVMRDSRGFVWFVTGSGLCRYDGYDFKEYGVTVPSEMAVFTLKEDNQGNIWFKTNDRCFVYDREKDIISADVGKVMDYQGFSSDVSFLDVDYDGNVWFSAEAGSLVCRDKEGGYKEYSIPVCSPLMNLEARDGKMFLHFTDGKVFSAAAGGNGQMKYILTLPVSERIHKKMYLDTDGVLWFYVPHSSTDNLMYLSAGSASVEYVSGGDGYPVNYVTGLADDEKGNLWIGTDNAGIIIYEKSSGKSRYLTVDTEYGYSLPSNHINYLYLDFQDIMWVGTSKRGVAYTCLNNSSFTRAGSSALDDVSCILEDNEGDIWYGTDGSGIFRWQKNSGRIRRYDSLKGEIPGNLIVCSYMDSKGRIWFGTFGEGIFFYQNGTFRLLKHPSPEKDALMRDIRAIEEDSGGNIWIGTIAHGLFRYGPDGEFTHYTSERSALESNAITALECNRSGSLYIGTSNGLFRMDTETERIKPLHYDDMEGDSMSDRMVTSLFMDRRGLIWSGSRRGLAVIDDRENRISVLDMSDGISNEYIRGMIQDEYGNVWITTDTGVTTVYVVDDPAMEMPVFRCYRYYDEDGLDDIMFNLNSICCLSDGSLQMGGMGGVVSTMPVLKPPVSLWHNLVFTSLYVAGERIEAGEVKDRITLSHNYNSFSLGVSSLDFQILHKNQMQYRLVGMTDWMMMESNLISFSKLPHGTYELEVRIANVEMNGSDPLSLTIDIQPPLWKTPQAYAIYILLLCTFVTLLVLRVRQKTKLEYKLRILEMNVSQQQKIEEAHVRFFTNVSHDLRTPLSLVITPLARILKRNDLDSGLKKELTGIHHNASILVDEIDNLLDFNKVGEGAGTLNLIYGNLSGLVRDVCSSFRPYSVSRKVRLNMSLPSEDIETYLDKDKMQRILMNLLSNAYKFNVENGTIDVSLGLVTHKEQEMVCITVADTGTGISDEHKKHIFDRFYQGESLSDNIGSGIGLNIVKEYVALHKGTVSVSDNSPSGAVFTILLPYERKLNETAEESVCDEGISSSGMKEGTTVLIVEDNEEFRKFLVDCLGERFRMLEAEDGKKALAMMDKVNVNLVISDVMMPNMDGLKLCRKIKSDIRYSHIPVILLTAKTTDDSILEGLKDGCDDYITKPFNLDILLMRIEKLLLWSQSSHSKFRTVDVSPSEITITSLDEQLLRKAVKLVEDNISNMDFSVDDLSSEIGITRGHLYKKLMAITGKAPLDFIRTIRLKRGRQLLEKSQLGVSDIAYRVGLSPKQFAKYFKEVFGELPSEYKKKYAEGEIDVKSNI